MANVCIMISWLLIIIYFFTIATCSNETDLSSLLAFKNAIHGDPLRALSSWNETRHFCNWYGISCGRRHQNRVVSIHLESQGLVGSLSPHIACFFVFVHRKKKLRNLQPSTPCFDENFLRPSYADILKSTGGFSGENLLGARRFGSVFKGFIDSIQMHVAVKVINLATTGAIKSFMSEYSVLRNIRHKNLLKIFTICSSTDFQGNDFKALVYAYMANGSLEKWIHQNNEVEDGKWQSGNNLSMIQRLNICIDIACGVEYLHRGTDSVIVHGDLKPSNILLDEDMTAYVGDFGLAKVISSISSEHQSSTSTAIRGTIGYIPPEYGMSAVVSPEGDVYSYGILLLEIFTNQRPTDHDSQASLHDIVSHALTLSQVMTIVDPAIVEEHTHDLSRKTNNCMNSLLEIGVACSKKMPRERMLMTDVVGELHKIKKAYMAE